jgi:hypothetical protein
MNKLFKKENGQALVIIALAAVALFGFAALAIDGSNVFSDRRHAQNAADTSAMAAALAKVRNGTWEADGLARAASNGYDDNGTTNDVYVYNPPVDGIYAGNNQYIQVKIISQVNTFFARVIGIPQVTNRVQAVTRVIPTTITPLFNGNSVVGLAPHDCQAVKYQGNANTRDRTAPFADRSALKDRSGLSSDSGDAYRLNLNGRRGPLVAGSLFRPTCSFPDWSAVSARPAQCPRAP